MAAGGKDDFHGRFGRPTRPTSIPVGEDAFFCFFSSMLLFALPVFSATPLAGDYYCYYRDRAVGVFIIIIWDGVCLDVMRFVMMGQLFRVCRGVARPIWIKMKNDIKAAFLAVLV